MKVRVSIYQWYYHIFENLRRASETFKKCIYTPGECRIKDKLGKVWLFQDEVNIFGTYYNDWLNSPGPFKDWEGETLSNLTKQD